MNWKKGSRLHLGAGGKRIEGYVNTDGRQDRSPDGIALDVLTDHLPDDTFSEIYACHLLEHVYRDQCQVLLRRWLCALQPGGVLRLSVPDLRLVLANCVESTTFNDNPDAPLFGDYRSTAHEWDRHKRTFTRELLARELAQAGFTEIEEWRASDVPCIARIKDWSADTRISLNMRAIKPLREQKPGGRNVPPAPSAPQAPTLGSKAYVELSVITATYNRLELLRDLIKSIRSSLAGRVTYEIVVSAAPSDDGTDQWLSEQEDVLHLRGDLSGAINAFNDAYAHSRGELVASFNDDSMVLGDSLYQAIIHLRRHPEVAQVVFEFSRDGGKTWTVEGQDPRRFPHPNLAITRRLVLEDIIAAELGAFWGDEAHRTHPTYGGDTYQWIMLNRRGWRAITLPGVRMLDRGAEADDELRRRNLPSPEHHAAFRKMTGQSRGLHPHHRLRISQDAWPNVYVPERGRLPRRSPIAAGPPERLLLFHMGWRQEQQTGLRKAFAKMGPTREVPWVTMYKDPRKLMDVTLQAAAEHQPTLVWAQVQRPDQVPLNLWDRLREICPPECLIVWWNGDVRRGGTEEPEDWAVRQASAVDLALVSNCTDPEKFMRLRTSNRPHWGTGYMPCGYDPELNHPRLDVDSKGLGAGKVVFAGQNYVRLDQGWRRQLFAEVDERVPDTLAIFGSGWDCLKHLAHGFVPQPVCAEIYRRSLAVVSSSLFVDLRRYSSDRLKRALGCGALVLMRSFDDYEGLGLVDRHNVVIWDDVNGLVEAIKEVQSWTHDRRRAIQNNAHQLASTTMTWDDTVEALLAIVRAERHKRAVVGMAKTRRAPMKPKQAPANKRPRDFWNHPPWSRGKQP